MRAATGALIGAILVAAVVFAITPARHWSQDLAVCRGGERVSTTSPNTSVIASDGRTADDFAFICRKDTGPTGISQRSALLGGIGISLLLGGLAGGLVGLIASRSRRNDG